MKVKFGAGLPETYRQMLASWVSEQGLDPKDVPADTTFEMSDGTLTVDVVVRNAEGACQVDPHQANAILRERRTVPLRTPFPSIESWEARGGTPGSEGAADLGMPS